MSTALSRIALIVLLGAVLACRHPGPAAGGTKTPERDGTIAGIVSSASGNTPLAGRKVTAINIDTNARYDVTTGADGGYTVKVPMGRYRLDLELHPGETLQRRPDEIHISRSDLDSGRNFVVAGGR